MVWRNTGTDETNENSTEWGIDFTLQRGYEWFRCVFAPKWLGPLLAVNSFDSCSPKH